MIDSNKLIEILTKANILPSATWIVDRSYSVPSKNWIINTLGPTLRNFQAQLGVNTWTEDVQDCDDFARLAAAYVQFLHYRTLGQIRKSALSFGEVFYVTKEGGGHAINIAIVGTKGNEEVIFFEPQTGKIVELTLKERDSIYYIRF